MEKPFVKLAIPLKLPADDELLAALYQFNTKTWSEEYKCAMSLRENQRNPETHTHKIK